jgi:hypothetical protein
VTISKIYEQTATPVNKNAALALRKGEAYQSNKKILHRHWKTPQPLVKVPRDMPDLTHRRFGRFRVMGKLRHVKGQWLVRCDCGNYEARKTSSILKPTNSHDRCAHCREIAFHKYGKDWQKMKNV